MNKIQRRLCVLQFPEESPPPRLELLHPGVLLVGNLLGLSEVVKVQAVHIDGVVEIACKKERARCSQVYDRGRAGSRKVVE
jgi:hypothetical protein